MKLNTPNKLTLSRMFAAPLFLASLLIPIPHKFLVSLIIFAVASVTDAIDGKLARKNDEITVFGKLLDPIADKMLTTAAFLGFLSLGLCNVWIVMIVLSREFIVTSIRLIALSQGVVIPANIWGKLKTASQMTFIVVILLACEIDESFGIFPEAGFTLPIFSDILLWIAAALTAVSGIVYISQSRSLIDFSK